MKLILTLISINLGLPLPVATLDPSQTNFSGWRGAMDQAKMGWRHNQKWLIERFHRPVYLWKMRNWIATDPVLQALVNSGNTVDPFSHRWNPPQWPYIEPMKDAMAVEKRLNTLQTSLRRAHNEMGQDFDQVSREIIEDRAKMVSLAFEAAEVLNTSHAGLDITWKDLYSIDSIEPPVMAVQTESEGE